MSGDSRESSDPGFRHPCFGSLMSVLGPEMWSWFIWCLEIATLGSVMALHWLLGVC